jgi:hypothetical protein
VDPVRRQKMRLYKDLEHFSDPKRSENALEAFSSIRSD